MAGRRTYGSYNDGCAAAHALDVVGDRWTMIVVRELLLGPKRFTQLQRDVVGIGPSVLAQRLHELEQHGVLAREHLPAPADVDVYALTAWGQRLEAVNTALSQWAVGSPTLPWDADMSPDTLVLAMRAHARPGPRPARVELRLTDSRRDGAAPVTYRGVVGPDGTRVERGTSTDVTPDATLEAATRALKAVVIGGADLDATPGVRVTGDAEAVRALLDATTLRH
ncbi:winged helix-turn-helix transcriptional regulator [Cellulomonas sp. HD19AZ1]|uniref:winged helix-turn-helix transcriptional regulator n=1 Tax=Cellulomonas TaxID=1707 RepID=UPI0010715AF6|nr:helix-turn-helix domain-containing protein [Cellulomonas sp. HD19AZ1]TFH72127.1 transcriptional regulator [Cellulomonas sp. HD19AZ1]